jgi:SAM-dependent methyltransferase
MMNLLKRLLPRTVQMHLVSSHLALHLQCWAIRLFGRKVVATETTKARPRRERERFFERYCQGRGLDIGYGGDLVCTNARGWDVEHGDAMYLEGLVDSSFDFVYSSHTLEHMRNLDIALKNWWRVLRPGGYLLLYVPHRDLYEKKCDLPSRWNVDHKHFFLPDTDEPPVTVGLLPQLKRSLGRFELVLLTSCRAGHTVTDPSRHSDGEYSIEAVLRKPGKPQSETPGPTFRQRQEQ